MSEPVVHESPPAVPTRQPLAAMVPTTRAGKVAAVAVLLLAVFLVAVFVDARDQGNIHTGDTDNLVAGTRAAIECLRDGDLVGCGHLEGSVQTAVFPYPLLQYLPASVMVWFSWSDDRVLHGLATLSWVSVVVLLGAVLWVFRDRPRLAWLSVPVIVGGSILYHSTAAFGEALAATMVALAVVSAIARRPVPLFAFTFLACVSKETFGPFVLVFVLACAIGPGDRWLPPRRLLVPAVAGAVGGMAASAAFNVFRYGSIRNALYLSPELRTAGIGHQVEWFGALWFAPSAGIAWFWTAAFVLLVVAVVVTVRKLWTPDTRRSAVPPAAVVVAFGGVVAGLSLWFAPFGWITFGPRLAVPILPGFVIAVVHLLGESILDRISTFPTAVRVGIAGVLTLAALPQYGAPWRWFDSVLQLISPSATCPPMTQFDIYGQPATYYRCTSNAMWRLHPQILDDALAIGWSIAGTAWVFAAAGCFVLFVVAFSADA